MVFVHMRNVSGSGRKKAEACLAAAGHHLVNSSGKTDINSVAQIVANDYYFDALVKVLSIQKYRNVVLNIPRWSGGTFSTHGPSPQHLTGATECAGKQSNTSFEVLRLHLCDLATSRAHDSKATIFPFAYMRQGEGQPTVCRHKVSDPYTPCEQHAWHVCNLMPCRAEGHFCMPGPTHTFARVVLAMIFQKLKIGLG